MLPGLGRLCALALLASLPALAAEPATELAVPLGTKPTPTSSLVLIIDDLGNQLRNGRAAIDLPGKLTLAVLPHTPHGVELAERAFERGQEVMLHAPMSNVSDKPLGEGGLTAELDEAEFRRRLETALAAIPHVRGVNNHMGSYLTQQGRQMAWLMQVLRKHDLYFVDSRTSHLTVAARTAEAAGIPHLSRNVFLDNIQDEAAIEERFEHALALAGRDGMAVAIAHPYPETLQYLQRALPALEARGVRLLTVSEALAGNGQGESVAQSRTSMPRSAI